ncbi:CDP-diacylglycerol--glycerol-3-phosphate 3-phosphatidyltransferase [Mycoplasma hafezii]|uniref:CDP-diacylglycerol--glycerol-3-phosphate 3-phosphatidyltransferase n=1 Tax=Mycoplasma hafezii TaxID=525886 RepID=UPI003CF8BB3C
MKNFKSKFNLPNILTIIRLALAAPLIILMTAAVATQYHFGYIGTGVLLLFILIIFILSMVTDFLDGYFARKYKQITDFGKLWDPIADKAITSTTLIFLAVMGYLPFWVVALFIIRDLAVAGFRNLMSKHNIDVQADKLGKLKTLLVSVGIVIILFVATIWNFVLGAGHGWEIQEAMTYIIQYVFGLPIIAALVLAYISGFQYFLKVKSYILTK